MCERAVEVLKQANGWSIYLQPFPKDEHGSTVFFLSLATKPAVLGGEVHTVCFKVARFVVECWVPFLSYQATSARVS